MKIKIGPYRKNRAYHIHIDDWDVWSLDYTLATIIHPALIRLKEINHGYPELWEEGMVTSHNYDRQLHFKFIESTAVNNFGLSSDFPTIFLWSFVSVNTFVTSVNSIIFY